MTNCISAGLWVDGEIPSHPHFEKEKKIQTIISSIKIELSAYIFCGIKKFKNELNIDGYMMTLFESQPLCWEIATKLLCYGVIYWISRSEAKKYLPFVNENHEEIDAICEFIQDNHKFERLINYAIHCFVLNKKRSVGFSNELIPKCAIYSVSQNNIYVRKEDFNIRTPRDSFEEKQALYDLHDFSHFVTASLCPDLYGCFYFTHLILLPKPLRDLIKSPSLRSQEAIPYSDGVVFSEILTALFDSINFQDIPHDEIVVKMSDKLALYYLNKASVLHPSTGTYIHGNRAISIEELLVLTQNKSYELPASEMEQKLFTRGGVNGDDPLKDLKPSERINFLATSKDWLYFEMRNTLKHRAHKRAYKIVSKYLLDNFILNKSDRETLVNIINNIDYIDFKNGNRINLWDEFKKTTY